MATQDESLLNRILALPDICDELSTLAESARKAKSQQAEDLLWTCNLLCGPTTEVSAHLANIYSQRGDFVTAERLCLLAINLGEGSSFAHASYSYLLNRMKRYRSALEQGSIALGIDPDYPDASYNTAIARIGIANERHVSRRVRREQLASAEVELRKASSIPALRQRIVMWSGYVNARLGHYDAALPYLKEAVALDPADFRAECWLSFALRKSRRYGEFGRLFMNIVRRALKGRLQTQESSTASIQRSE